MSNADTTTQSAISIGVTSDGRWCVLVGRGVLLYCDDRDTAKQAKAVIDIGFRAGVSSALSLDGVRLASREVADD